MLPLRDDNPTSIKPIFTIALIVINCVVFLYQISLGRGGFEAFTYKYGLIPVELMQGRDLMPPHLSQLAVSPYLNVLTSMFMHGGFLHLGGNMLYLWVFGNNIEDQLGHVKFLIFYLAAGVAASLSFVFLSPGSDIPMVGASGAISGILGAYMVRFPQARVHTLIWIFFFIRIVSIPAIFLLGFWFLLQVINGSSSLAYAQSGGVAWFAHIGGFVFGAVVFLIFRKKVRRQADDYYANINY